MSNHRPDRQSSLPRVVHVIAPYTGESPLKARQAMFLESIDRSRGEDVALIAVANAPWQRSGWTVVPARRTAAQFGEASDKPFLKDLLDAALAQSRPDDWLFYSNVDCSLAPDLYGNLMTRRASVVEYQRREVEGPINTLDELLARGGSPYSIGLDALAIRASLYRELRDELPDFVVGEPHWDTIYSGLFRRLLPVQRDCGRLFHPKHAQVWDLAKPTRAGAYNQELFVDCLNHGVAEKGLIEEAPDRTDTAVIITVFGTDPLRIAANVTGLREQLRQDLYADLFFVELVEPGTPSAYPEDVLHLVRHVRIEAPDSSAGLFQKEALYNRGWRTALADGEYEYFIFLDADVYCDQRDWFRRIRARLRENPARAVQGWRTVSDTVDPALRYSSVGAAFVFNQPTDLPLNPGMCWGMHRRLLEAGDGFNPYCLDSAGDSAFVAEYLNTPALQYDPWLYQWRWFSEIERPLPFHADLDCVPLDVVHVHHGPLQERNYDGLRYALDAFPPLLDLVHLNGDGILEWRDRDCPERRILEQRSTMQSRADVDDLLARFEYPRYARPMSVSRRRPTDKQPFGRPARSGRSATLVHHTAPRPKKTGIKIFDPQEVFRQDFPFSWCDGVEKAEKSTYAPLRATDAGATLVLAGKVGAPYIVCALPVQPTWLPLDISGFTALRLGVYVAGHPADVWVSLVSQTHDGAETESRSCSLKEAGLEYGRWVHLSVPLRVFHDTVDLTRIRLVKFIGHESFRLELRHIYIR